MGNPGAAAAALEALETGLRTLICAAQGTAEVALVAEDLAFWAALAPEVVEDVGVYLATTNDPADALVSRLQGLLSLGLAGPEGSGIGVLRLAVSTFHGLKIAKRWDALQLASVTLLDAVAEALQQRIKDDAMDVLLCLMELYEAILLGYQHGGSLMVRAQPQIMALAPLIAVIRHEALSQRFLITAAALAHSQRAYESEGAAIQQSLVDAFSMELARRPVAECESALREAAWIAPGARVNKYISTIEGKWLQDEFSSEKHASATTAPQNAGSITLRKVANVLAYDFHGTVGDTRDKMQLQLDGALIGPLDQSGCVDANAPWQLEGHWVQVVSPAAVDEPVQIVAPIIKAEPWSCVACTFSNEGGSGKCATCGTEAPKNTSSQTTKAGAKTTNPAPFLAVFDVEHTVMRVRWSRGEQSGVWLAKKEQFNPEFNLTDRLREATASAMADSNAIPVHVYSPRGDATRVLLLEKSYSLSTYGEMAIEFWVQLDACSSEAQKQTILATGEFEVFFQAVSRNLVWNVGSGLHVVTAHSFPGDGQFHHVVLLFTKQCLQILVNGVLAGHCDRTGPDQTSILSRRTPWVSIGGCVSDDLGRMDSIFHGSLVDFRIWSDVNARSLFSPLEALSGSETGLIGYFPLVGDSHRILLDASKHDNHAIVFGCAAYKGELGTLTTGTTSLLSPSSLVGIAPVKGTFSAAIGNFEISGTAAHSEIHGKPALRLNHPSAVWFSSPVSIAKDFRTVVTVESTELVLSHANQLVFALSESSFWDASPLISEVASLGLPFTKDGNQHLYSGTALLVAIERLVVKGSPTPEANVAVYVWKNRRPYRVCRVSKLPVHLDKPNGLAVSYVRSTHMLRLEVLGSGTEIEVAIDIETALGLCSSRLRTGVILASPLQIQDVSFSDSPYTSHLTSWTFESIEEQDSGVSVIDVIYPRLKQISGSANGDNGSERTDVRTSPTTACTRTTSDGSAIEQATYGCQTCGVVHGAGLCSICAIVCHEGHELVYMGSMITACACSMRSAGSCKCVSPVIASDYPKIGHSAPKVAQWYCNRCTVVNAAGIRECTVCANTAPDNAVLGLANPVVSAPESTSRALVPVQATDTAPVAASAPSEWSCPACTYLNSSTATKCTICESAKPEGTSSGDGLLALYDAIESQKGNTSVPSAPQPGLNWYCSACTMENKSGDTTCFMCQTVRTVPVASEVKSQELVVGQSVPTAEVVSMATPMETDFTPTASPSSLVVDEIWHSTRQVAEFHRERALEAAPRSNIQSKLIGSGQTWDSTAGLLTMSVAEDASIAQYIEGEYTEKDGYVRGLSRLVTEDGVQWKFDGRFKKLTQSQENAVSLLWEKDMSRFSGKWYRGDGSGEWKCLSAPIVNDFRGLAPIDATKRDSGLQPFYSGLINMKQNLTNVCYQNSFLQSLFLTQDFRRLILASKVDDYLHMTIDGEANTQGNVLKSVQDLFARLIGSQRTEIDSHGLQRCLPPSFQAGRQQDTSDFAHFLIDSLSQQLNQHPSTAHGIDEVFGGTQATILACKTCGNKSVNREYFWELLLNMIDLRYTPITSIAAVSGTSAIISTPHGYERINSDLNKDRNGAPYVYLCVKRRPEVSVDGSDTELPITDLVVKVAGFADVKPVLDGYERVELDLNIGGSAVVVGGKKQVYLFFRREPNGSPITDLQLIYGNESVPDGFKQIRVDLNQGEGTKVFLCYRCDMPITDMKIVNSGIPGYRMVDHVLNCSNEDTVKQYLAFKVGGAEPCITDLRLVPASEEARYHEAGWDSLGSPSSTVDEGVEPEVLVIRRGHGNPIFAVDVFRAPRQVPRYNDYEVIDLYGSRAAVATTPNLSVAAALKGDWLGDEVVDRGRKSVRIHSVSDAIFDALVIKGSFEDKGEVSAVATATLSSWTTVSGSEPSSDPSTRVLRVTGHWKSSKTKQAQLFDVELRPGAGDTSDRYMLSGTIGDGRGRPIAVTGTQTSHSVRVKWPISQIFVLRGDERVPEGAEVVRETCSGRTGNLLAQTQSPYTLYIAVKREENPSDGFVGDICVIYGEIDVVPENYTCIQTTPSGYSANLNDGTSGVPIFICYRRVAAVTDKSLMDVALVWTSGTQADPLPVGFTKIQHTPLGMEANLNQGTSGVSIYLCFAKTDPADIVRPVEDVLNGEYEIVVAPGTSNSSPLPPLIGKFIRLAVAERAEAAHTIEGKFGTVFHGYQPGMVRGILYRSEQRKQRVVTGVWMSDEQNASSMIDFVPPSFPFEWTLNDSTNELDGWWCGSDDASSISYITAPPAGAASSASAGTAPLPIKPWKLMKDAYVRIAFKKDYGTEWKDGQLISSERVWRHDVASMLSRFVASRTLGGDNLLSCSQCDRKTESRTNTVVVAPPAHLILTIKRMFYDWAQQKTRKSLHDVTFPALLTLPALTSEDEDAVYTHETPKEIRANHRQRQYGLYGVLVHSGLTANSGHYFSYCRESDDSTKQLHLEDSALTPWIKFNDSRVERSSWAEINAAVSHSVSDTVYLLLYKRLSYEVPEKTQLFTASPEGGTAMDIEHTDDEDEAMLLAKAMALSMSAASQKKSPADAEIKAEETKQEHDVGEKSGRDLQHLIDRAVVKEVEAANAQYLWDTMRTAASAVHVQDLHTAVALRYGLTTTSGRGV